MVLAHVVHLEYLGLDQVKGEGFAVAGGVGGVVLLVDQGPGCVENSVNDGFWSRYLFLLNYNVVIYVKKKNMMSVRYRY